jgi:hypothetical protein
VTTLKKLSFLVAAFCIISLGTAVAQAPQFDMGFGYGTVIGQPASDGTLPEHFPQSLTSGGYPVFSGDFIFKGAFGVGGEVSWRAHQNIDIFLQPYRPIFTDFNGVYAPNLGKKAQAELQGGIGWETIRFYEPFLTCTGGPFGTCTNFVSSNHFLGHVGGGIRFYLTPSVFVRPEAHFYFIHNNLEFSGPRASRFGMTLGYSFKNQM